MALGTEGKGSGALEARELLEEARRIVPFGASPIAYEKFVDAAAIYRSAVVPLRVAAIRQLGIDS
jgi:hypothetical protein